jgi:hypothetical protein
LLSLRSLAVLLLWAPLAARGASHVQAVSVQPVPVPEEFRSSSFTVTVNGQPVDVAHAAANYDFINFDMTGPVEIAMTADEPGFWDRGVDVEPWRLGIRPVRDGKTIRFTLEKPAKLSIGRPRDFLNRASMLFVFAGSPPKPPGKRDTNVRIIAPGVHREGLNPKSGETIYMAPGAFVLGSLNLWRVDHVKIYGRGTFLYDGPQDPATDEGWMQKQDWHCIGSMESHDIEIDGVTCVLRSRTWSIQMKDSYNFTYDDLRVVGGNSGNANQDGMDWIGSYNGLVRNSFFRASDDVIALMGNWDGYTDADMVRPGNGVHDITVENSQLSTSISNIVRAGWPKKIFNSYNFTLRNSDVLHGGIGACGQQFGLIGFWGANGSRGDHANYTFENLFLDNWYSLLQMEQDAPSLRNFTFRNIWALDQPPLAGSNIAGWVSGLTLENVKYGQKVVSTNADVPLSTDSVPQAVKYAQAAGPVASFKIDPPTVERGRPVNFEAKEAPHAKYAWVFGDGTRAEGRKVQHTFADADGTDLDGRNGAGRFRVMLHVTDKKGAQDWASQGVVAVAQWLDAGQECGGCDGGLAYRIYPGPWTELPDLSKESAILAGEAANLDADAKGFTKYAVAWDGFIDAPVDGGYTFHLMSRDGARVVIDGREVARTGTPFAQVCGSPGNAMRYDRGALGLRAGRHAIHVEALHNVSGGGPRLLWEGPGIEATDVPSAAYSHPHAANVGP